MYRNIAKQSFYARSQSVVALAQLRRVQTRSVAELLDCSVQNNASVELNKTQVRVVGWVKSFRDQKEVKFIHIGDGTSSRHLQLVCLAEKFKDNDQLFKSVSFNASVEAVGILVPSTHQKQQLLHL